MKATEFDRRFDAGEDMSAHVDWTKARRVNAGARRANVDSDIDDAKGMEAVEPRC